MTTLREALLQESRRIQESALREMPGRSAYELGFAAGLAEAARRIGSEEDRERYVEFIAKQKPVATP